MRINRFIALATGVSRRSADKLIDSGKVLVDDNVAKAGMQVTSAEKILLEGEPVSLPKIITVLFHKPVGYVVSRKGQGSKSIYDILPEPYQSLKPVGRLDKNSSGLLALTNNGDLAHNLTHPSLQKLKIYIVTLDKPLIPADRQSIERGIVLSDGVSKLQLQNQRDNNMRWEVRMHEGRNRQIRRTFDALGYTVTRLHRVQFGPYTLGTLRPGEYKQLP